MSLADKRDVIRSVFDDAVSGAVRALSPGGYGEAPAVAASGDRDRMPGDSERAHGTGSRAAVTMTVDPDSELQGRDRDGSVGKVLGREVTADFRRDPRLVGGMIVRVKDRVMDGSVRRQLQLMRRALIEEASGSAGQADRLIG